MSTRYESRSYLTNLHARSRLFTNTPRREGYRVKKIRTDRPPRLLPVNSVRMPISGNGRMPVGHLRPQSDAPSAALFFFLPKQRCRSDILSKFAFEGRFYKLPPQSFFMSVFLRCKLVMPTCGNNSHIRSAKIAFVVLMNKQTIFFHYFYPFLVVALQFEINKHALTCQTDWV